MKIFKKKHTCDFNKIVQSIGYPLRLCILKCECGTTTQEWIDTGKRYEMKKNDVEVLWDKENRSE